MEFRNEGWKKEKERNAVVKLRTGSKKRRPSALRICNTKQREGRGRVISLARFEYRNPIQIYIVYRSNVSRWKFIHATRPSSSRWVNFFNPPQTCAEGMVRLCRFRSSFLDRKVEAQSRNLEFLSFPPPLIQSYY